MKDVVREAAEYTNDGSRDRQLFDREFWDLLMRARTIPVLVRSCREKRDLQPVHRDPNQWTPDVASSRVEQSNFALKRTARLG